MAGGPTIRRHRSVQEVETPEVFLNAVRKKLQIRNFTIDLAASASNAVTKRFISKEQNSLVQPWDTANGWGWLNPEFSDIAPWVAKAAEAKQRGQRVAVLIPASVGTNWWKDHVHNQAAVWFLNGRIQFVGHDQPYPKDCALLLYNRGYAPVYTIWSWQ